MFDDFDPSQIAKPVDPPDGDVQMDGMSFTSQTHDATASQPQAAGPTASPQNSRKRRNPPSDIDEEPDQGIDNLLPAAAAMKKRKIEAAAKSHDAAQAAPEQTKDTTVRKTRMQRKKSPEIDVREETRKRREAADEAARLDDEALHEELKHMDIAALRDLAKVEEMDVQPRSRTRSVTNSRSFINDEDSGRWKPEWNGRKNFKRFRRKTDRDSDISASRSESRGGRIMVPLEEVKKKGFGMGDEYWLESTSTRAAPRSLTSQSQRDTQNASQSTRAPSRSQLAGSASQRQTVAPNIDNEDQDNGSQFRSRRSRTRTQQSQQLDQQLMDEVIDPESAAPTASATSRVPETGRSNRTQQTSTQASTQRGTAGTERVVETQVKGSKAKGKRPATESVDDAVTTKRPRGPLATAASRGEDSDSEDELRFRFRSRRK